MSVLIKNMEMPNKCWDCELFDELAIHFTGITAPNTDIGWCRGCKKEILDIDYKEHKPIWCPLVEIPTPHGDLIDREKLAKTRHDIHVEEIDYRHRCISLENLYEAQAVIESEE